MNFVPSICTVPLLPVHTVINNTSWSFSHIKNPHLPSMCLTEKSKPEEVILYFAVFFKLYYISNVQIKSLFTKTLEIAAFSSKADAWINFSSPHFYEWHLVVIHLFLTLMDSHTNLFQLKMHYPTLYSEEAWKMTSARTKHRKSLPLYRTSSRRLKR